MLQRKSLSEPHVVRAPSGSWWITLVAVLAGLALFGAMAVVLSEPESPGARLLREVLVPQGTAARVTPGEYLVFMEVDTPQARRELLAGFPALTHVADSILPGVIVVSISGEPEPVLAQMRESLLVGLVMRYNPDIACH